ncbi:MAG TPA: YfiR family protein [Vicinamibacteria bacterium]|jgi:hypothetical protein|nr:YfiR family protein [Vicinamibacteria bacterium]
MVGEFFPGHRPPVGRAAGEPRRAAPLLLVVLSLLAFVLPSAAFPQETPVSVEDQIILILKILTYDRQLEFKAGKELTIGVVYNPSEPASVKASQEASEVLTRYGTKSVKGLPIRHYLVEYTSPTSLDTVLKGRAIGVFYVCPGTRGLDHLLKTSESHQITTTTGVRSFVSQGIAVGVASNGEKPLIFINLPSAKAEGVEFDASLLRIATIVR